MALKKAICPVCKQQIEVNPSDEIDLCKLCGKPFTTKDAIKLYIEHTEVGRELSAQAVEKFYAILSQDCEFAHRYLNNLVKNEYPSIYDRRPLRYKLDFEWNNDAAVNEEAAMKEFFSLNPTVAEMYLKLLNTNVRALCYDNYGEEFSDGLTFLKLRLKNIETRLLDVVRAIDNARGSQHNYAATATAAAIKEWEKLVNDIKHFEYLHGKEFDDEYILYVIDFIDRFVTDNTNNYPKFRKISNCYAFGSYIEKFVTEKKIDCGIGNLYELSDYLAKFLSSSGKEQLKKQRAQLYAEREQSYRELQEKRYKDAYKDDLPFWRNYVNLLKEGKTKAAFEIVERMANADLGHIYTMRNLTAKKELCKTEVNKFVKRLFGVKYTGDISALKAETLAELSAKEDI